MNTNPYKSYSFNRALLFGVLCALVVHLCILLVAHKDKIAQIVVSDGSEIIRVEQIFLPPPQSPQEIVAPKKKIVKAKIIPNVVKDSVVEVEEPTPPIEPIAVAVETEVIEVPVAPPPPKVEKVVPVEPPKPAPISKDSIQKVMKAYLVQVKKNIDKNKLYPTTARRLNQEGTVRVRFTVQKNGRVEDIHLAKGSDYSALDQSALDAVAALTSVAPIPDLLNKDHWTIEIPIKYQLH